MVEIPIENKGKHPLCFGAFKVKDGCHTCGYAASCVSITLGPQKKKSDFTFGESAGKCDCCGRPVKGGFMKVLKIVKKDNVVSLCAACVMRITDDFFRT